MAETARTKSAGGSANELGSLHRNGAAALLATYGLSGATVDPDATAVPVEIAVETEDAVDDIVCTMESGERWFIQAKRSIAWTKLDDVFVQWRNQQLSRTDSLVLLVGRATGRLAGAMQVLESRRRGRAVELPAKAQRDFDAFEQKVRIQCGERTHEILKHARIIAWEVTDLGDVRVDSAAARLQAITTPGTGLKAFEVLRSYFQHQAANRTRTGSDDWIRALRDHGLDVRIGNLGTAAAARERQCRALADYRRRLASRRDQLDIGLISPRVPVLTVAKFIESVQVEYEAGEDRPKSDPITHIVRRNNRFVLRGLPGAGKSECMRQLAAWIAAQPNAPTPIFVSLRALAHSVQTTDDLSESHLLRTAASSVEDELRDDLVDAFRAELERGSGVFLLDGLDETHAKRGIVTAGLSRVLAAMREDVGAVISTRESAMDSTQHLSFPTVDLKPSFARRSQNALVDAFAVACNPSEDLSAWRREMLATIDRYARAHREIWDVPLLATLATLRLLEGNSSSTSVVELLMGVINESVDRWEALREDTAALNTESGIEAGMLHDGFAILGRALDGDSVITRSGARAILTRFLNEKWGAAPRAASRMAEGIVTFWDEKVGVYVDTESGLQPRSQIFAELGDAIAANNLDTDEERVRWLDRCLDSPAHNNALKLATTANGSAARWLIRACMEESVTRRQRALTYLVEFLPGWQHLKEDDFVAAMMAVASAAGDGIALLSPKNGSPLEDALATQEDAEVEHESPGWRFAIELACIPVPSSHRSERDQYLTRYTDDAGSAAILDTLKQLVDAEASGKEVLPRDALASLEAFLERIALPDDGASSWKDEFGVFHVASTPGPRIGVGRIALRATTFAKQLSSRAANRLYEVAQRLSVGEHDRIVSALDSAGFKDPFERERRQRWRQLGPIDTLDLDWFVPIVAAHGATASSVPATERWRMTSLADLAARAGVGEAPYWAMVEASRMPAEQASTLFLAVAAANGIDFRRTALEAMDLMALPEDERRDRASYLYTPRLGESPHSRVVLPRAMALDLVDIVAEGGHWASDLARNLLLNERSFRIRDAAARVSSANWRAERNLAFVRLFNSAQPLEEAARLLSESSGARVASALFLSADDTPTDENLLDIARADPDATVRDSAGALIGEVLAAEYWTCIWCYSTTAISVYVCSGCGSGSSNSLHSHEHLREHLKATTEPTVRTDK